jgi:hypothetical protein
LEQTPKCLSAGTNDDFRLKRDGFEDARWESASGEDGVGDAGGVDCRFYVVSAEDVRAFEN